MTDGTFKFEINKFLKDFVSGDILHFVLAGSVISGEFILDLNDAHPETISLQNVSIRMGSSEISVDNLSVPYDSIFAWGC
jgi:hypothetical protein